MKYLGAISDPKDLVNKGYVDGAIPTKVSDLTNDSGFITGYTETDPTVPAWAKASSKPTYTASEVSAVALSDKYTRSSAGDLNWSNTTEGDAKVIAKSALAFWNGAYSGSSSNLQRVSGTFYIGGTQLQDFVKEKGTSGSWYYRKWNSGVIEAVFHGSVSYGTMSASGQLYRSTNNAVAIPSGIFTVMPQRTEITINNASTVVVCATAVATSTTNVNVQVWRSTNSSSSIDATIRCTYTP